MVTTSDFDWLSNPDIIKGVTKVAQKYCGKHYAYTTIKESDVRISLYALRLILEEASKENGGGLKRNQLSQKESANSTSNQTKETE